MEKEIEEIEYNWKMALLTAIVITIGGLIVFAMNSSGYENVAWENVGYVLIPLIWVGSFAPVGIVGVINKIRRED